MARAVETLARAKEPEWLVLDILGSYCKCQLILCSKMNEAQVDLLTVITRLMMGRENIVVVGGEVHDGRARPVRKALSVLTSATHHSLI